MNRQIEEFFDNYASRFNDALNGNEPDIDATVNSFTECFLEANPKGVKCGKNDKTFRHAIPKGFDFYKSIGTIAMDIGSKEITTIDYGYYMVKIHWLSRYNKEGEIIQIDFDNYYFVRAVDNEIKIFAYITGDADKAFKEHGLLN